MSIHRTSKSSRAFSLAAAGALAAAFFVSIGAGSAAATSYSVNSEAGYREALTALSNDSSGAHVIEFTGNVVFDGVSSGGDAMYSGDQELTILGNGYTLDAAFEGRALHTIGTPKVTVRNLTVTRGQGGQGGACCGGLYVFGGRLDIIDSVLTNNWTDYNGDGAAAAAQELHLIRSTVTGNTAYDDTGGITAGTVVVVDSTISDNEARGFRGDGAGILGGDVTIINSTVVGNRLTSGSGGAGGGGVWAFTSITLEHATIADNVAPAGKADNVLTGRPATTNVPASPGSISSVASVVTGGDLNCQTYGGATTSSYSYDDDGSCGFHGTGDTSNGGAPMLGALADNGGPTWTMAPALATSLLVDVVPAAQCTLAFDQRGVSRPQGSGCDTGAVEVEQNRPPSADADGPYLVAVNTEVSLDGTGSSDPDGDPLTYAWLAGQGSFDDASLAAPSYLAPSAAGIYEITLRVEDGRGGIAEATTSVVVYDPAGGFVTGGGWFYSEPGAYTADPSLEGKASFGFVAKYKKGAQAPDGNTEFQFRAADLNFQASDYDWLVVVGHDQAKFKGVGTINGTGEYRFMVWAGDDTPDTFRIKIWTEAGGIETVVYDNGGQSLSGGNIVVHRK